MTATQASEVHALVRVSFFMRLLTLFASLFGLVEQSLTAGAAAAIVFLALTSMAGLSWDSVPDLLHRHPIIVVADGVVMTAVMVTLGTDNPLVLAALSSCVVIGVLLPPIPATLSTVVLVNGYLAGSLNDEGREHTFISLFGLPITFISVVVLSQVFRVLAERKRQSERAFADLVSTAAAAQERARLARELHDSTAKTLQGLALSAKSLGHWIRRDPDRAITQADDIADSADTAIARLRVLLSTLRQDDLDQPFHESLATLARDTAQAHGVRVQLDLKTIPLSAPGVRYELLAAVREAITNAATHSGAEKVFVTMSRVGEEIEIEIRDEGAGFSLDILPDRERDGHFGVRGYSERLEVIGGRADVVSAPGKGTRVHLSAPVMGLREEIHE